MALLLDHPLLASRYFFPRTGPLDSAFFVPAADGTSRLGCYRASPFGADAALTVLHFHGNAETVADYVPEIVPVMNALGVNVFLAEYRGYGASTGTPSLCAMLDDARAVLEALGVPASRVVAFGRSLGSLFAVEVAARHPDVAGLILESGIAQPLDPGIARVSAADLGASADDLAAAVAERFDQRAKLSRYRGPLLVMHTAADMLIPASHGRRLFDWGGAPAGDKTMVVFDRGDHGTIYPANRDGYVSHLAAFFERVRSRGAVAGAPGDRPAGGGGGPAR